MALNATIVKSRARRYCRMQGAPPEVTAGVVPAKPGYGPQARRMFSWINAHLGYPQSGGLVTVHLLDAINDVTPGVKALAVAKRFIGVHEQGGNNRGPLVEQFLASTNTPPGSPWCAAFVNYCFKMGAGIDLHTRFNAAYCPEYVQFADLGLHGLRVVTRDIQAGDLALFDWGGDGIADHIGFVTRSYPGLVRVLAGPIDTEEGNTGSGNPSDGDGVYVRLRRMSQVERIVRVVA